MDDQSIAASYVSPVPVIVIVSPSIVAVALSPTFIAGFSGRLS